MSPRTQRAPALRRALTDTTAPGRSHAGRELAGAEPPRVMVLWCPDWPVTAAVQAENLGADAAVALIEKNLVFASSAFARAEGVTRGLRLREAQARCPELIVLDYDPSLDNRAFEPVLAAIEQLTPGVQVLRPGVCAVRIRGAARYYGGEKAAALALAGCAADAGGRNARVGVADGIFTADQAARLTGRERVRIVPAGESERFLAPLDIGLLDDPGIVTLLRRLGIRTLAGFAELAADDVRTRFGEPGARLHSLARGRDSWPLTPRTPPSDHDLVVSFEPALDIVEQVAFGVRTAAERFVDGLTASKLVCTAIRVELHSDSGELSERVWLHPRSFSPGDVVDRVRWQVSGAELSSGVTRVRVSPEAVDAIGNHESGLWGSGPDERIHHALSRVQSMLGHGAVLMPGVGGGRTLSDRQQLVAWGDRAVSAKPSEQPWPGSLPAPFPGTVFSPRHPVQVLDERQESVGVDDRGALSAAPARFAAGAKLLELTAWAGPWPLDERWWSSDARKAWRVQAVDSTGCAWLLVLDGGGWWAEARYD
ncbi:MAG: polymerase family protein [Rhodoglobus sp.]|nr:polymerase family protein [Rhodoglobus sp.]